MSTPFKGFADLDRTVHEPSRLALLTALAGCESADFVFLQRLTGMTNGNISVHLSKLEAAGLVKITKEFVAKKPRTVLRLTKEGREAVERHWKQLEALRDATRPATGGLVPSRGA